MTPEGVHLLVHAGAPIIGAGALALGIFAGQASGPVSLQWPAKPDELMTRVRALKQAPVGKTRSLLGNGLLTLLLASACLGAYAAAPAAQPRPPVLAINRQYRLVFKTNAGAQVPTPPAPPRRVETTPAPTVFVSPATADAILPFASDTPAAGPQAPAQLALASPPQFSLTPSPFATEAAEQPAAPVSMSAAPPTIWKQQPTAEQISRAYPRQAAQAGISGKAGLSCSVDPQGQVKDCVSVSDSPLGAGFGEAAMKLARYFAVAPKPDASSAPKSVFVPVLFSAPARSPKAAASAQPATYATAPNDATLSPIVWKSLPDAAKMWNVYPKGAASEGLNGEARLSCHFETTGQIDTCAPISESPPGRGFAAAAMKLVPYFAMEPRRDASGVAQAGTVVIPVEFDGSRSLGGILTPQTSAPVAQAASSGSKSVWRSLPTAAQMAQAYPIPARIDGISGQATLSCKVDPSGQVNGCSLVGESPLDQGFGTAAMKLAPLFAMEPRLDASGAARSATVLIPVQFKRPYDPMLGT